MAAPGADARASGCALEALGFLSDAATGNFVANLPRTTPPETLAGNLLAALTEAYRADEVDIDVESDWIDAAPRRAIRASAPGPTAAAPSRRRNGAARPMPPWAAAIWHRPREPKRILKCCRMIRRRIVS